MGDNVLILEITSGICCILTAIFLHYSAIPKSSNKKNYQKGYTVVKIASLVLGISALLFAYFGNVIDAYEKKLYTDNTSGRNPIGFLGICIPIIR